VLETPDTAQDDAMLVERARRGDVSAYEVLVRLHEAPCIRTAYGITGDAEEARDAVQDAFVKAYYNLDRFRAGAPFRPWISRIAANEARNRRVAAGRRQGLAARGSVLDLGSAPSPEDVVLDAERRALLVKALNELRPEDRLAIAGRYFLDLSEGEMAETLGWPRGTVKSRLSRALGRLRHRLIAAAVLLILLAAGLAASPPTRTVIADWLGVLGIRIQHTEQLPTPPRPPASSAPAELGLRLKLGEAVTLDEARRRASFSVLLPTDSVLARPDEVFFSPFVSGGHVSSVYGARPGLPPAQETGVSLLISQFRGTLAPDLYVKGAGPNTVVESLTVNGGRAVWMAGDPHSVVYRDGSGRIGVGELRLAANVLAWEQGDLTLRLEGALNREEALHIATSIR